MSAYLFIGEQRSRKAIALGVTWRDGRLAARTLFRALQAAGLDPAAQSYRNLWGDDGALDAETLEVARTSPREVVALGRKVQRGLAQAGIPHRAAVHPAARGAVRLAARYDAQLAAVLR